jgi:hypothetical protein
MWKDGFAAFDAAWTRDHYHRRASEGGVRETFYAAGFHAGSTVAPDLLAALERAVETLAQFGWGVETEVAIRTGRAAIAKAYGEASRAS